MLYKTPVFARMPDRPFAHCATLVELPDGTLLCAWMGGAFETAHNVAILASRSNPERTAWGAPYEIAQIPGKSAGQPVFSVRPDGELWLFFVAIMDYDWTSAQPFWQRSLDNGQTWQDCRQLMDYAGLMFRSKIVELPGRIIVPAYDENTWQSTMMISEDDGQSWTLTDPMSSTQGNIHPTPVHLEGEHLLAYIRTGGKGGVIWRSESLDGGAHWTQPAETALPNPNSGIDLIKLQSGALALAYNPSDHLRTPISVSLAPEGENWLAPRTIEDEHHEISYPTLLQTRDGDIHLVYTYRRENIHYARFTEDWLMKGANTDAVSKD